MKKAKIYSYNKTQETLFYRSPTFFAKRSVTVSTAGVAVSIDDKLTLVGDVKLFTYISEPIFGKRDYNKLIAICDSSDLLNNIYNLISFHYDSLMMTSYKWYSENIKAEEAFDYERQITRYVTYIIDEYSCPILKVIDLKDIDNNNIHSNICESIRYSARLECQDINKVLYEESDMKFKPYNLYGKKLFNSVTNLAYQRFKKFLIKEASLKQALFVENKIIELPITDKEELKEDIDKVLAGIKNNLDRVNIQDVYNYFLKALCLPNYLSKKNLILFLQAAFDERKIPNEKLAFNQITNKGKIMTIFRYYFDHLALRPHGKTQIYSALLGNYFEGFTTNNVYTNFNKYATSLKE